MVFSGAGFDGAWFLTYIGLFSQIINPFKNLSSAFSNVQKGTAALERIEQLLDVENTINESPNAKPIKSFEHNIEFKNVSFAYGDKTILDGINLTIEKGKMVALVGASGAGKSTFADLVPRFHDVTGGEILIDGINLKDCKLDDLRRLMGVVSQRSTCLHCGSIATPCSASWRNSTSPKHRAGQSFRFIESFSP